MRVVGVVRSRETWTSEASGPDQTTLRRELLAAVPAGFEAERVHGLGDKSSTLEVVAHSTATRDVVGDGATYLEARAAVETQIGQQELLLSVRVED